MCHIRAIASAPRAVILACLVAAAFAPRGGQQASASELRHTAIVKAVVGARGSVVNIHGQKMLPADEDTPGQGSRAVNGMGTGVLLDERGYLLTNFHVIDGVKRIQVTNAAGQTSIAKLIAHDRATDLAVIKIPADDALHVVPLGSSHDLMVGETVIAIGNAYGYNHSVTRGIISALHRDVPISETQQYYDLIQTDAGINPGNSGGPLLNIEGKMVGLNVAVRVGAQNIGFAIPVNQMLGIAAKLIRQHRYQTGGWHGVACDTQIVGGQPQCRVTSVEDGSPAADAGIKVGDLITAIDNSPVHNALDLELAVLDRRVGEELAFATTRNDTTQVASISIAALPEDHQWSDIASQTWQIAGLRLSPLSPQAMPSGAKRYRGGLKVTAVRPGSPAEREHIQTGDVLVGMHEWETVSLENVSFVLSRPEFSNSRPVKCFIVRDDRTHFAYLPVRSARR